MAVMLPRLLGAVVGLVVAGMATAADAATVTLRTNDAAVVSAFGEAGQGWWNPGVGNGDENVDYTVGGGYRNFFTFDLNDAALQGQAVVSATLRLQVFNYFNPGGIGLQFEFFDVDSDPSVVNFNSGLNAAVYFDLGSGTSYGQFPIPTVNPASSDVLEFSLNAAAIAALTNGIGQGFFVISGTSIDGTAPNDWFYFRSSEANGNQQLVLDTVVIPLPAAFPLFATALAGMGLLGWRRKRKASV